VADRSVASPEAAFETANELVPVAQGALSLLDELAALLERERVGGVRLSRSDPVLLAGVGVLSLRRSLARWLHAAAHAVAPAREETLPDRASAGRSLLR
jgi:hypothetical protein